MTSKELLYVEDALGHEKFMQSCSCETSKQLQDQDLVNFVKDIEQKHAELASKFLNLL